MKFRDASENRGGKPRTEAAGYSMPEVLLVVSVIGVISALSYPVVRNFSQAKDFSEAQTKAESLTVAKILFYRSDPLAASKWVDAKQEDSKFDLIEPYLFQTSSASTLEEYAAAPPYDEFILGETIKDPVRVYRSDGNNGHGNNEDGVDVSNSGKGKGGPNGEDDPSGDYDDEKAKGKSNE